MPAQSDDDHGSDNYANNNYRETYIIEIMKKKDPTSHRIIEKRRRDRMNNCLADLSKLIPAHYMKKGRGRVEKTEIIEMAIKHLKDLIAMTSAKQMGPNDNNHLSIQQDKQQQQQVAAAAAAVSIKSDQEQQLQRPSHSNGSAIIRNNGPSWYKKAWLVRWLLALAAEVSDESRLSWR